ncbi:hypothetical protein BC567DRAFT_214213 [Phyllosticta citribraziliensis]
MATSRSSHTCIFQYLPAYRIRICRLVFRTAWRQRSLPAALPSSVQNPHGHYLPFPNAPLPRPVVPNPQLKSPAPQTT